MTTIPKLVLASGDKIPQFGVGTWQVAPADVERALFPALEAGVRRVDTAQMYGNEGEVGRALEASGIARADLFVTTKLNNCNHEPARVGESLRRSLELLRTDYVDLFLIHWPLPERYGGDYVSTWEAMLRAREDGLARNVGVSNFQVAHLRRLGDEVGELPAVNQIEAHPYFPNATNREFAGENGIVVEAWSPLAQGRLVDDAQLAAIGRPHGKTAAQVALRWAIQRGDVIFPKSVHADRARQNLDIFDFELDEDEMRAIAALDRGEDGRQGPNPDTFNVIR